MSHRRFVAVCPWTTYTHSANSAVTLGTRSGRASPAHREPDRSCPRHRPPSPRAVAKALGQVPASGRRRPQWRRRVLVVTTYRDWYQITNPTALGADPEASAQRIG